jgi:hypothetical protein
MSAPGREFIDLLSATVVLGAYRSVLADVLTLAQQAPGLSNEQARTQLVGLGARVARRLGSEIR